MLLVDMNVNNNKMPKHSHCHRLRVANTALRRDRDCDGAARTSVEFARTSAGK